MYYLLPFCFGTYKFDICFLGERKFLWTQWSQDYVKYLAQERMPLELDISNWQHSIKMPPVSDVSDFFVRVDEHSFWAKPNLHRVSQPVPIWAQASMFI